MPRRNHDFQSIRSEGGLLPPDMLRRILDPREKLAGTRPEDYGLPQGERLNEVITQCWNRLRRHWSEFRTAAKALPEGEAATGVTNDKWSLPLLRELGFGVLTTGAAPEIDGRTYAISRFFASTPVHLVGCGLSLDRRTAGARGAAVANPHGLVQEFLNRSQGHLWGIVSNGLRFRVLRDSQALSRQSYLEFDLEAMFDGELYADFVLVWLTAHATRFVARDGDRPETCWLEEWTKLAEEQGTRALGDLRQGVEQALQILGQGLVGHPRNTGLREALRTGQLPLNDFHGQLLRVVYRLIFLFVAEDRVLEGKPLLHAPDDTDAARIARERYAAHYSTGRLRELASRLKGSRHGDLWQQFHLVVGALSTDVRFAAARQHLALPILGGFLWNPASTAALNPASLTGGDGAELANADFLDVIRHLAFTRQGKMLRPVDYKNLGSEELGGVYESLLALTPQVSGDGARFTFAEFAGNERKTSGSYYTPDCLVQCLLDSALDPVVAEAIKGKTGTAAEQAILALKVCDPACGSGHFLVGAAHRLARHLARVRALAQGESEPSPSLYQHALRDVIGHCLYGVDINPMAVELCRVSLWLEAMEPGKPLSFLDHHIQCGNSLLGTTPELIAQGIPDDAFKAIEGDDKKACTELRKRNKTECKEIGGLFVAEDAANAQALRSAALAVDEMPDETPEAVQRKADAFTAARTRYDSPNAKRLADTWCAAFVIEKRFPPSPIDARFQSPDPFGVTQRHIVDLAQGRSLPTELAAEVESLAGHYQFLHWHLAFPDVFAKGGFDCVLGNPPWDTLSPDQREFFGKYHPGMRSLSPSEQTEVIDRLTQETAIAQAWIAHCRDLYALVHFLKNSGRYTLYAPGNLGKGDFNVYRMFVELAIKHTRDGGGTGQIVPAGFYGGANASAIRQFVFDGNQLIQLVGCENKGESFFPGVHPQTWFAAYALRRGDTTSSFRLAFGVDSPAVLMQMVQGAMQLRASLIRTMSPDTYAIPDLRNAAELAATGKMLDGYPAFGDESAGPPFRYYQTELHMGNDRGLFSTEPAGLPVYEGRMIDHFDHRAKTYQSGHGNSAVWIEREFDDPDKAIVPQWRVLRENVPGKVGNRVDSYRIGFGDVANPRNERSFVAAIIPPGTICGHTVPTILFDPGYEWAYLPWLAVACSFTMDALARRKLSSPHMTYSVLDSLPFPRPVLSDPFVQRVAPIVLRLVCTAPEMTVYWNAMAYLGLCQSVPDGTVPPDALVDPDARALARAELDALVARDVFGLTRQELSDILDTFPVLARRDEKAYGEFRTKRLILDAYDVDMPVQTTSATLAVPLVPRIVSSHPGVYAAQLILWLLKQSGGRCERVRLARAFALLSEPEWLVEFAPTTDRVVAEQWHQCFNEVGYSGLFATVLRRMLGGEVVLRREHDTVYAVLAKPDRLLDRPWIAFDARLALNVLDCLPDSVLNSTPMVAAQQEAKELLKTG